MEKTRRVIGTAGHIDHGKTALVRALTGIDCDRLPEEKRRGITIDLGFAHAQTDALQLAFVDVPGHERFVKRMLAGAGGIDCVLLVVSAEESIKPQTREHFEICRLLKIPTGVVALTKSDLVDGDTLELVKLEVEDMVRGSFLENAPIVPVSSVTGTGIEALREAIDAAVRRAPERDAERKVFRLPIDRVFTMKGFGCVVTGTAVSGTLRTEDTVEILPSGKRSRARALQVHGTSREQVVAGERVSMNLSDVALDEVSRGEQAVEPSALRPSPIITCRIELLSGAAPLEHQTRVRVHLYAAELLANVHLFGTERITPGGTAFAQLRLESPVLALAGDRFVIRSYSPAVTIGGGSVIDPHLPKMKPSTRTDLFESLEKADLRARLVVAAKLAGLRGITADDLQSQTGLRTAVIREQLSRVPAGVVAVRDEELWLHEENVTAFRRAAMDYISAFFKANRMKVGLSRSELVQKLLPPRVAPAVADFLVADLVAEKIIVVEGELIDVPGRSKNLSGAEGELARFLEERFRSGGLAPPPVSEIIREIAQKPKVIEGVIAFLVKTGKLVRVGEGIYLHPEAIDAARARLEEHKGKRAEVGWFKELYGISRKIIIPLLEHFDRIGATRRVGDVREVR